MISVNEVIDGENTRTLNLDQLKELSYQKREQALMNIADMSQFPISKYTA